MPYRFSQAADEDYFSMFERSTEWFGTDHAELYLNLIDRSLTMLSEFPEMGRLHPELGPGIRAHPAGSHIVLYSIDASGDVLVIRIRHHREDWTKDPA